jgi:uncharacterized membrane protein YeaQ/YmgE (transglycosylase-associated protein family)
MLWILVVGIVAGIIARFLMAGPNTPAGFVTTVVIGVAGAFFATWLGQSIGWYRADQGAGFIASSAGAIILLFLWNVLSANRLLPDPGKRDLDRRDRR